MRRKSTIENELRKINAELWRLQREGQDSWLARRRNRARIKYLNIRSFDFAWTLSKVGRYESRPNPHACG